MEFLRSLWNGVVQAWRRLSVSARVNIGVATLLTVGVILALVIYQGRPEYVTLYTNLGGEDSAAVRSALEDLDIRYDTAQGGATVRVPAAARSRALLELSAMQIPKAQGVEVDYSIFDEEDVMTTRYEQEINQLRAKMGAAQKQLNSLAFVDRSWVHIAEAQQQLFVQSQQPSQASVTLELNRAMRPREVKAVVNIVSSHGGANLDPANITVVDTEGNLLHSPMDGKFASVAGSQLEMVREWEREYEESATAALRQIGVDAVVRVAAKIDFRDRKIVEETLGEPAAISEMSLTSEATTTEPPPVGPVGATVNLPDEAEDQGRVVMNTTDTEEITNNEVGKRVETTEIPPGTEVEIVGVTCVVEGSYEETEEGERQYVAPTDEDLERYAQIVRNSVGGVDAALVTTSHQAFELDGLEETVTAFERTEFYRNLYKLIVNVGKVVLVLVLFLVARWLLLRMFAPAPEEEEEELVTEESAADRRRREMAEDISRASQEQPESVANLIRSWMSESEE